MTKPTLSIVAILISLVACAIALLRQPATVVSSGDAQSISTAEINVLIKDALDDREQRLIRDLAPKIVIMTKELGTYDQLNVKSDPSSIEELISPFFKMTSTVNE